MINTIIRRPNGTARQEVEVDKIQIPDLWHSAMFLKSQGHKRQSEEILDCWQLAHDLITNIQAHNKGIEL